jgi:hypothetical protein
MKLEFDVPNISLKFVKYVIQLPKIIITKKNVFSLHKVPKQLSNHFGSQGILGIKHLIQYLLQIPLLICITIFNK